MELFDNHNHSQFSFDGFSTSVEKSARRAAEIGLAGLCFTDHCDFYVPPMKAEHENLVREEFDVAAQQAEIDRVQAMMPQIRILKGIEMGVQKDCRGQIAALLESEKFDQIIASVHYLDETDPFWGGYYEDRTWKEAYGMYLETLFEEMVWLGDRFDVMGHYDYVTRYAPYPECSILYKDFPDLLDEMLRFLADNGKALEINTKTYQDYSGRTPLLDPDILRRYRELGGEIVSFGSDSHAVEHVGFQFAHFQEYLKAAGFRYEAHFESRKLCMTRL